MHKYSLKIAIRPETNRKGQAQIRFNCRINNELCRVGTTLYINPIFFNNKKIKATVGPGLNKAGAAEFNRKLQAEKEKALNIFKRAEEFDEPLTVKKFKRYFQGASPRGEFIEFARDHIQYRKQLLGITNQTARVYYNTLDHISNCLGTSIPFHLLENFPEKFEQYMKNEVLGINTRKKYHSKANTLITAAINKGLIYQNPYANYKIGTIKGNRQVLTIKEVQKLVEIYSEKELQPHLQNTLSYFLFSCFTGLRYSDLAEITHSNIIDNQLVFNPVKGKRFEKTLTIPLPKIAKKLIVNNTGRLFNVKSDQKTNLNILNIMKWATIKKHITMHSARHTFGTMFILLGGNVAVLKELMGHAKLETTSVYINLAEQIKREHITIIDDAFEKNLKAMVGASFEYK